MGAVARRETVAPTTSDPNRTRVAARVVIWVVLFLLVTAVQLVRQSGLGPWHTIWAEDGGVFYQGTPTLGHLLDGYAGYLEVVPRVVGFGAHLVPLHLLAWYFALAGAVVTTLCAAAVWRFSASLIPSRVLRATLALSVVLLPALLLEQLANSVNAIWALTFAAWWAILYRPESERDAIAPTAVVFLAVASQAITLVYAPVVAYVSWRRRDRRTLIVSGAFVVGSLLQFVIVVTAGSSTQTSPNSLGDLPKLYVVRVLGSALVGENSVADVWDGWGIRFAVLAALVFVTAVVLLVNFAARRRRVVGLVTIAYSVGIWVLCVWGRGSAQLRIPAAGYNSIATRWSALSIWLLLSGMYVLAASITARTRRTIAVSLLIAQFGIVAVLGFRGSNPRSLPPTWTDSIRAVQSVCASGHADHATALVSPPNPYFGIVLTCSRVR